jgi:antitoxin (DNA-binding transcriptional repressor) of toxin-antitoxin stability system
VIDEVERGATYLVTKRGRLAAVLLPVGETEDFVLANADEYVRMHQLARSAYAKSRTTNLEDLG